MKKLMTVSFMLLSYGYLYAQENSAKLNLSKGQKITMKTIDTSIIKNKMGENDMEMKTYSTSTTEVEIIEVQKDAYSAASTLKQINVDFEGYGQKMKYNSESKEKQDGMMAESLKKVLNKADTIKVSNEGKMVKDESKKDKEEKGMMQMMRQGGANIENAFLLIPSDAKEGNGWKADKKEEDLRTQTIYFIEKINGNIAEVSFKRKSKGTVKTKSQMGGDMNVEMDNLSNGNITVDKSTGLVKSYNETTNSNSKMNMGGMDITSTGTISTHVVFE